MSAASAQEAHDQADLVAQQEAAHAATRAADSAERQEALAVWIGAATTITSAVAVAISVWVFVRGQRTAHAQLRAYVALASFSWQAIQDRKTKVVVYRFTPVWKNTGATRTRKLHLYSALYADANPMPVEFNFAVPPEVVFAPVTIDPGEHAYGESFDLRGTDLNLTEAGSFHFYLWGSAIYRDVFSLKLRETRYCRKIELRTGDATKLNDDRNVVGFNTAFHTAHNDTEDDLLV